MQTPDKILVIKPSSLGDVVHSLPFLGAIKELYPESSIHWVIAKGLEDLLQEHPMIDKLWIINKDRWKGIGGIFRAQLELRMLFRSLRSEKYDLVVDLQGLFRSGLIAWSTRSSRILGFSEAREGSPFFYTDRIEGGRDIHAVDRYLRLAAHLGWAGEIPKFTMPGLPGLAELRSKLPIEKDYAVIIPGARWETKKWPAERFGEVAAILPLQAVVIGSKQDIPIADRLLSRSGDRAVSLAGRTTLKELVTILGNARFVLTNDTGPMHIAAALGIPVFAVFGPTSPVMTGPYGSTHTIIQSSISCSPCFLKRCNNLGCMLTVSVEEVYSSITKRISL